VNNIPTLRMKWDAVKAFGPGTQGDPDMQGTDAANPSELQTYVLQIYNPASSTYNGSYCAVRIEFDVVWDEFKTIAAS